MKMTINLTVSLLLLSTTLLFAQHRFSVGLTAAPVLGHASGSLTLNLPDQNGQLYAETFDNRSTSGGFVVGMPVRYNFTPKWSVTSGFWYTQFRTSGAFPFSSTTTVPARIISSAFNVPLMVDYRLTTRRLSPYFSLGAIGSFRRPTLYKPTGGSGLSDTKVLFGKHELSVQALIGAGVEYRINPHLSIIAQPLLVWRFKPSGNYSHYVSYQVNGKTQLVYSF